MINSLKDYKYYLECDRKAMGINRSKPRLYSDDIWKWTRLLRKLEYIKNCRKGIFSKITYAFYRYKFNKSSMKLGFSIGLNVFGHPD
jgi:serine O-acetyltransferase